MRRASRRIWLWRGAAAFLLAAALAYTPYHLYTRSGFAKYLSLRKELAGLQAVNAQLRGDIARLEREAEALRNDPRAIERVARQELGWVRSGDVVVDLSGDSVARGGSGRGTSRSPVAPRPGVPR